MGRSPGVRGGNAWKPLFPFWLLVALTGFAIAQPIYDLILRNPEFLTARQNTNLDTWLLAISLTISLPLLLAVPATLLGKLYPQLGRSYLLSVAFVLSGLFFAQVFREFLGPWPWLFFPVVLGCALLFAWMLLYTRWRALAGLLTVIALVFPILFLVRGPDLDHSQAAGIPEAFVSKLGAVHAPVVMVVVDELSIATLLDSQGNIDQRLFPNIHRIQQSSDWYRDTISVADGTLDAVPAILTGWYPDTTDAHITVANTLVNLFTLLQGDYRMNVVESVTRLCPQAHCPVDEPRTSRRFTALLLDVSALYLHRVYPDRYKGALPVVTDNWSGFFTQKQEFFPGGWVEFASGQTLVDRPGAFSRFTDSIVSGTQPALNFFHFLFPHVPYAYLPDGKNYGLHWLRGLVDEQWQDSKWGVVSGRQRHFLQAQYLDAMLGGLLDHLEALDLFDQSMIVLVADHGISFQINDMRRALTRKNTADVLRIPLLIKNPHQSEPAIIDTPAMTIDVLPTMLASLGYEIDGLELDGVDLSIAPGTRDRQAISYRAREYRTLATSDTDIGQAIRDHREQLKLDDPKRALWGIGPLADFGGSPLSDVCPRRLPGLTPVSSQASPVPAVSQEGFIPAFQSGWLRGEIPGDQPYPFVLTDEGIIVASGETWKLQEHWLYAALVEPGFARSKDWKPEVWVVTPEACLGGAAQ